LVLAVMAVIVDLHPYQAEAFFSEKRITIACSGIQGGKTEVGNLWFRDQIGKFRDPTDNFILASPDYKILSQSTFPVFMHYMSKFGDINKKDMVFKLHSGGTIFIRSMHDPYSCEGIRDVRAIYLDEGGKANKMAWVNLNARAAFRQANIFVSTTPYSLNWLYKDVYKPWRAGDRDDVAFITWKSVDNPHFPKEEFERQKALLDARIFAMKFEGEFNKMAGLVFMDFGGDKNYYAIDKDYKYDQDKWFVCAGVDWGYTNPFAITVRVISNHSALDIQVGEFYKSFLNPSDKVEVALQFKKRYGIKHFYCDNEDPAMINMFNVAGLTATAVKKYPGSVMDNIQFHNEIIKTGTYKLAKGACPYTEEEYETYHYKADENDSELNEKENPVDANNHLMTANMYVTAATKLQRAKVLEGPKLDTTHLEKLLAGEYATVKAGDDWYEN